MTRLARTARAEALGMPRPVLRVVLPLPPTINHAYIHTRYGTRLHPLAAAFRETAVLRIREALNGATWPQDACYRLTIDMWFANKRRHDLDNGIKATQDATAAALAFDDSRVVELHVYHRGYDKNDPRCELFVEVL